MLIFKSLSNNSVDFLMSDCTSICFKSDAVGFGHCQPASKTRLRLGFLQLLEVTVGRNELMLIINRYDTKYQDVVNKLIPDSMAKDIEKAAQVNILNGSSFQSAPVIPSCEFWCTDA